MSTTGFGSTGTGSPILDERGGGLGFCFGWTFFFVLFLFVFVCVPVIGNDRHTNDCVDLSSMSISIVVVGVSGRVCHGHIMMMD